MATVTVRDFATFDANTPPPTSIWLSSQPPKMSPFALVSAGIASVRMQRSPPGPASACSFMPLSLEDCSLEDCSLEDCSLETVHLKLSQPGSGAKRSPNLPASARKVDTT